MPSDAAAMRSEGESHSMLIGRYVALAVLSKCEHIAARKRVNARLRFELSWSSLAYVADEVLQAFYGATLRGSCKWEIGEHSCTAV